MFTKSSTQRLALSCYLSYLQKVPSKSLVCGWCRRVGETWEISGGLKWCCLCSGSWIEPQMISLDWWPHLQTARVILQERHFNFIATCMSIATALWILVEGLDLDICLEMHTVALAYYQSSQISILEGKKKGSQTRCCNTVHHNHSYKPTPSLLIRD